MVSLLISVYSKSDKWLYFVKSLMLFEYEVQGFEPFLTKRIALLPKASKPELVLQYISYSFQHQINQKQAVLSLSDPDLLAI